jgi:predicted transcriptional regulator
MDPKVRHDGNAEVRVIERVGLNTIPNQSKTDEQAGVSRSYLSQLEKGAFYASLKILDKLAKALNVEAYELIVPTKKRR